MVDWVAMYQIGVPHTGQACYICLHAPWAQYQYFGTRLAYGCELKGVQLQQTNFDHVQCHPCMNRHHINAQTRNCIAVNT